MTDLEIMSLPDWDEALSDLIADFRQRNRREPTELEIKNLIEILLNRYRDLGYLIQPVQKIEPKRDRGIGY